jgi:cytochrome c
MSEMNWQSKKSRVYLQRSRAAQGCQIFLFSKHTKTGKNIPNDHKRFQMAISYAKWLKNIPNGHKIYQHFPFFGPSKFTQIGILGM